MFGLGDILSYYLQQIHNQLCKHFDLCTDDGPLIETFALLIVNLVRLNNSKNHYLIALLQSTA